MKKSKSGRNTRVQNSARNANRIVTKSSLRRQRAITRAEDWWDANLISRPNRPPLLKKPEDRTPPFSNPPRG